MNVRMNILSDEFDRYSKRINYSLYPWLSLPFFVAACILSAIYQPPLISWIVVVAGALLGGVCFAYGPVSRHRWIGSLAGVAYFLPFLAVIRLYSFGLDGRFFSLLLWATFGLLAPFWVWRKRGLEIYRS